jgi:large subunit ribosomal protein L29
MAIEADKLRELSDDELVEKLAEAKEELFNLRFQLVTGQLDNPMRIKQVRKHVARILTLMRENELEALEAAGTAGAAAEEA